MANCMSRWEGILTILVTLYMASFCAQSFFGVSCVTFFSFHCSYKLRSLDLKSKSKSKHKSFSNYTNIPRSYLFPTKLSETGMLWRQMSRYHAYRLTIVITPLLLRLAPIVDSLTFFIWLSLDMVVSCTFLCLLTIEVDDVEFLLQVWNFPLYLIYWIFSYSPRPALMVDRVDGRLGLPLWGRGSPKFFFIFFI